MAPDKKNLLIGIACLVLGILLFLVAGFYILKNINPSLLEKAPRARIPAVTHFASRAKAPVQVKAESPAMTLAELDKRLDEILESDDVIKGA